MRHFAAVASAIVLASLLSGCVHVREAMFNIGDDVMDLARADVSVAWGTGLGGHVMATKLAQLKSNSYEDLYRAGFGARYLGITREEREDWWVGPFHSSNVRVNTKGVAVWSGLPFVFKMRGGQWAAESFMMESPDEIGVAAHLCVIGARLGVRPLELIDLLANFVGLDPCHDNPSWPERCAVRAAANAAEQQDTPMPDKKAPPQEKQPQGH